MTFAQKMKYRVGSKAFPGPKSGPHLFGPEDDQKASKTVVRGDLPILDVRTPCQCVTDYHHVILCVIHLAPGLVRDGHIVQDLARLHREFGHDGRRLLDKSRIAG